MNVNPGELNKRIKIIRVIRDEDEDGYFAESSEVAVYCWAKFTRTSGTELVKANADFSEVKCRFLIRYHDGIHRKMRVEYDGDVYEIVYVNDYEDRHQYIELWCERLTREEDGS